MGDNDLERDLEEADPDLAGDPENDLCGELDLDLCEPDISLAGLPPPDILPECTLCGEPITHQNWISVL